MEDQAIVRLSLKFPEWGADKIGPLVRKEKLKVVNDRVRQVRRKEEPVVPPSKEKVAAFGAIYWSSPSESILSSACVDMGFYP